MATIFTKIIEGELPGRFVWRDDTCVAFLSIRPLKPGHTLVVPRAEVDEWLDLDAETWAHLTKVCRAIGAALRGAFSPEKVGVMLAGLEVPHVHLHLVPIWSVHDLDFANQETDPASEDLDRAADSIRRELRRLGHEEVADS